MVCSFDWSDEFLSRILPKIQYVNFCEPQVFFLLKEMSDVETNDEDHDDVDNGVIINDNK